MKVILKIDGFDYSGDLSKPTGIGIMLRDGNQNPNCFYANDPEIIPFKEGDFIGDISAGSPVNFKNVIFNPHGNGTHTECSGHIRDNGLSIGSLLEKYFFTCRVISLSPIEQNGDLIIGLDFDFNYYNFNDIEALVVRTIPNSSDKLTSKYSGKNPPYFDPVFLTNVNQLGIQHFLTDLPSVDKEIDGGELSSHRTFWENRNNDRTRCTITELIYVPDHLVDGVYLLELQLMNLDLDAAPSRPVLYSLRKMC
ncbi:MAG: cyclase family protein [Saprospirales bacterium]|nr:MAG: cyclase family protein [Saprospirales bacterium]